MQTYTETVCLCIHHRAVQTHARQLFCLQRLGGTRYELKHHVRSILCQKIKY